MSGPFGAFDVYALGEILRHCSGHDIHALASTCRAIHTTVIGCYQQKRCLGFYLSELARLYSMPALCKPNQDPIERSQAFRRWFTTHTCRPMWDSMDDPWLEPWRLPMTSCMACMMPLIRRSDGGYRFLCSETTGTSETGPPVFVAALILDGILVLAGEAYAGKKEEEGPPKNRTDLSQRWLRFLSTFKNATRMFLADPYVLRPPEQSPFGWIGRILMLRPPGVKLGARSALEEKLGALLEFVIIPSLFHQLHWETVFVWCGVNTWRGDLDRLFVPLCPSLPMFKDLDHDTCLSHLLIYDPVDFVCSALNTLFSVLLWNEAFFLFGRFLTALNRYVSLDFERPWANKGNVCNQDQTAIEREAFEALQLRLGRDCVHLPVTFKFCEHWAPEPVWAEKYWGVAVTVGDCAGLLSEQQVHRDRSQTTAFLPIVVWLQYPVFLETLFRSLANDPDCVSRAAHRFLCRYMPTDKRGDPQTIRKGLLRRCQTLIISGDDHTLLLDDLNQMLDDPLSRFHGLRRAWDLYSQSDVAYLSLEDTMIRSLKGSSSECLPQGADTTQQAAEDEHSSTRNECEQGQKRQKI